MKIRGGGGLALCLHRYDAMFWFAQTLQTEESIVILLVIREATGALQD